MNCAAMGAGVLHGDPVHDRIISLLAFLAGEHSDNRQIPMRSHERNVVFLRPGVNCRSVLGTRHNEAIQD